MTDTPTVPDAAVRIATDAARWLTEVPVARTVLAALAADGWLHDPAEVDRLRARVAELEAANEKLRAAVAAHRTAVTSDGKHLPF